MRITHGYLEKRGACYLNDDATLEQRDILGLLPEEGVTPLELCDCGRVPPEDRFWVLAHQDIIPEGKLRLLAVTIARTVIGLLGEEEPDAAACLNAAERYAGPGHMRSVWDKTSKLCEKTRPRAAVYVWNSVEDAVPLPVSYPYATAYHAAMARLTAEGKKKQRDSWLRYLELLREELES